MEKNYWKSLEELAQTPEFKENLGKEFLDTPIREGYENDGVSRREFLKLMGASLVMASAVACTRRPVEKIVPYLNQPEEITPGKANWYTSTCGECSAGCGVLVKTREGRPIKLEGNKSHFMNDGGLCARGQASLLNLYDPDRLQSPVQKEGADWKGIAWEEADRAVLQLLKEAKESGTKVRFLSDTVISPSVKNLFKEFQSGQGNADWVTFDPLSCEELIDAQRDCYGEAILPRYRFSRAEMVVSFGADFLDTWISPVEFTSGFARLRKIRNGKMSRFVAFEASPTVTGTNADLHIPVKPGEEVKIALSLAYEIHRLGNTLLGAGLEAYSVDRVAKEVNIEASLIRSTAAELWKNRGQSLVVGTGSSRHGAASKALHVVVNLLNSMLGNDGKTIDTKIRPSHQSQGSYALLANLIQEMERGEVSLLVIHRVNPLFFLSKDFLFEAALSKVGKVVRIADRVDETALKADYVLPLSHFLESWGDSEPQKGRVAIVQPTIRPLYNTRSFGEMLLAFSGKPASSQDWYRTLRETWENVLGYNWSEGLEKGMMSDTSETAHAPRIFNENALQGLRMPAASVAGLQLVLFPSISQFDGRYANNSWLQELPDPVTKITWRNYLMMAPSAAKDRGLKEGDVVAIETKGFTSELPIHVQPGIHPEVVAMPLGFGRTAVGQLGNGLGVNGFQHVSREAEVAFTQPVKITKTGKWIKLASTQSHHSMEGRNIVKETTLKEYQKDPHAGNTPSLVLPSMWSKHEYKGHRWGMTIDLNACTGCSACVIACQAENNIPVVGEKQIKKGREMHWIRIDRYYEGTDSDNPEVLNQPMLCQHCENAPCETVCPVVATVHSDEGLNMQTYNRCVGTRYCANNCPYKVRRFNWHEYLRGLEAPLAMALNPDVTVREKGVMEKCTFCVQRIQEQKDEVKAAGRSLKDKEIQTACQQSCPAQAIAFGDTNDPDSEVSKNRKNSRGFHVLEELNVLPQVTYLTKVRNVG